jgi:hypothetical protein
MKQDCIIEFLARKAAEVLCGNVTPVSQVPDEIAIDTIRSLFATPSAQAALERERYSASVCSSRHQPCYFRNGIASAGDAEPAQVDFGRTRQQTDVACQQSTGRKFWLKKPPAH